MDRKPDEIIMKRQEKFESRADRDRNRLYVSLKGRLTAKELKRAAEQMFDDLKILKPGFDIITDISEFEPVIQSDAELLVQVHKKIVDLGGGRIARIAGENLKSVVGKIQFDRISRRANIVAQYFDSMEDAEIFLDLQAGSVQRGEPSSETSQQVGKDLHTEESTILPERQG